MKEEHQVPSVLVVDDSPEVRLLIAWSLGGLPSDHTLVECDSGKRAIELLSARTFTAMVIDQDMPGITGLELIRVLRDDPAHEEMPIVLMVGESDPSVSQQAAEFDVHSVIRKPFKPGALGAAIETAIAQRLGTQPSLPAPALNLQSLLDGLPYLAMIIDANHRVILGNTSYYDTTDAGIDDCGLSCAETVHGDAGVPFECPLEESKRTGKASVGTVDDARLGELRVSVFPLDRFAPDGERLFLHLAEPITSEG